MLQDPEKRWTAKGEAQAKAHVAATPPTSPETLISRSQQQSRLLISEPLPPSSHALSRAPRFVFERLSTREPSARLRLRTLPGVPRSARPTRPSVLNPPPRVTPQSRHPRDRPQEELSGVKEGKPGSRAPGADAHTSDRRNRHAARHGAKSMTRQIHASRVGVGDVTPRDGSPLLATRSTRSTAHSDPHPTMIGPSQSPMGRESPWGAGTLDLHGGLGTKDFPRYAGSLFRLVRDGLLS